MDWWMDGRRDGERMDGGRDRRMDGSMAGGREGYMKR